MTILGMHTVSETRDLIRATEFRVNKNQQQLQRIQMQRSQPINATQAALDADMVTFVKRWVDTRDKNTLILAGAIAANPTVNPAVIPAEQQYVAIDEATRRQDPRLVTIEQRIDIEAAALGLPPTDLRGTPPQNSPDADFNALRKLDAAIKAGEEGAKGAAKSNTGLIIGGCVIAALGIVVATKVYL